MLIALKSVANGRYVRAAGTAPLLAGAEFPAEAETFETMPLPAGRIGLRTLGGRWVCAEDAGAKPLVADRAQAGPWESFEWRELGNHRVALKSLANGRFVCAEDGGTKPLLASRTQVGEWETFERVPVPALVALRAGANGRFVCAENAGAKPLIANRDAVGEWETFEINELGGDLLALRSVANGRWVGVGAASMLVANRESIGSAETFQKVALGGGRFALRSLGSGGFVGADKTGALPLMASRPAAGDTEVFETVLVRAHAFSPQRHGFRFQNDGFTNDFVPALDIRTEALCGGMSYAALDWYFANQAIPAQVFRPAKGTALYGHLYNRQVDSITNNLDKWAELIVNPFGWRSGEFFRWGLAKEGRLAELRGFLDRGVPCVIGLRGVNGGDHQVVAFDYSMGRYQGDLGAFIEDFHLDVYDPNVAGRARRLIADPARQCYRMADGTTEWVSYFVDTRYVPKRPPAVRDPDEGRDGLVHELVLECRTGADDLRGGNDNVDATVTLADGSQLTVRNVNLGARWVVGAREWAEVVLPRAVPRAALKRLVLTTTFAGGLAGDNWNLDAVTVHALLGGALQRLASGGPKRFTGSDQSLAIAL